MTRTTNVSTANEFAIIEKFDFIVFFSCSGHYHSPR